MATTPTLDQYPTDVARVTMDATPGNCEQITLPDWVRRVTVTFKQSDGATADAGWLEFDATDGAAIGTGAYPIASGGAYSFTLTEGKGKPVSAPVIYLAADTASGFAYIHVSAYEGS